MLAKHYCINVCYNISLKKSLEWSNYGTVKEDREGKTLPASLEGLCVGGQCRKDE